MREVVCEIGETRAVPFMRKFHGHYLRRVREIPKAERGALNQIPTSLAVEEFLFARVPGARERADELFHEPGVRRPEIDDTELALPVSVYGGG